MDMLDRIKFQGLLDIHQMPCECFRQDQMSCKTFQRYRHYKSSRKVHSQPLFDIRGYAHVSVFPQLLKLNIF